MLLSHNREKYIRGAIESAFAQDYEGELEYIFSDDCSTDRTFEIIKECVAAYKGNRRVVVTQTPKNLHLAGNTNHAVQFVTSDWIVRADDDDISVRNRCSIVGRAIAANPGCSYVYTLMKTFTDDEIADVQKKLFSDIENPQCDKIDVINGDDDFWESFNQKGILHQVWSMKHIREYGDLPIDSYWIDDVITNLRCCTLGYGIKINALTAYIRTGSRNMSRGEDDGSNGFPSIIRLERFHDQYYNVTFPPLSQQIEQLKQSLCSDNNLPFINSLSLDLRKRELLCSFWRLGVLNRIRISRELGYSGIFSALRCLPLPIFAFLLALYRKLFKNRK